MRMFMNAVVIANLVQMLRSSVRGALWICDSDEAGRFFEARCAHSDAKVMVAPGHSADVFEIVTNRGLKGVVATVAGDSRPDAIGIVAEPNIFNMLVNRNSLSALVHEAGGVDWSAASSSILGDRPEDAVLVFAGRISEICARENLNPDDFSARIAPLVNKNGMLPNAAEIASICTEAGCATANIQYLVSEIFSGPPAREVRSSSHGKLSVDTLTAFLRDTKPHGIPAATLVTLEVCWSLLRTAFKMEDFEKTSTFWDLRDWERKSQYVALREWRVQDAFGLVWDQRYWRSDLSIVVNDPRLAKNLAVLKLDLDNFKTVNSQLGHAEGDEALKLYLATTKEVLLRYADIYRRGGDEVVAIAPNVDFDVIKDVAEILRNEIESRFAKWSAERKLEGSPTASIGLLLASSPDDVEALIAGFDTAQNEAKITGKNKVVVATLAA